MASKAYIWTTIVIIIAMLTAPTVLAQQANLTVKIGALTPLTGGLQSYGIGMKNAVELAVEDANQMCAGKGIRFELLVEDTATDPNQASQKLRVLYSKGARLIVGPMSSGEVNAIKSFADQNHIIVVSPSSTSPLLAVPDWIFRMVPTDAAQGKAIADLLHYLGIKKVAIIYRNDAWGVGLKNVIANESQRLGIQVVAVEGYDPDPKAFPQAMPAVVSKVSRAIGQPSPDAAVVFASFEDDGVAAMSAAGRDPVLSKVRWIGTDGFAKSEALAKQVGQYMAATKLLGTIAAPPDPNDPNYKTFAEKFKAKYGKEPVAYDPYSYDAAMILMKIVCELGTDDPDKVKATLEQWAREGKYAGVTGKVYLDENGDRAFPNFLIWGVVLEGGQAKYIDAGYYYGTDRRIVVYDQGKSLFQPLELRQETPKVTQGAEVSVTPILVAAVIIIVVVVALLFLMRKRRK